MSPCTWNRPAPFRGWAVFSLCSLFLSCGAPEKKPGHAEASPARPEPQVAERPSPLLGGEETCFNALDDNGNGLIDEGCGVSQAQLQVVLAWPDAKADLDLYLTDPKKQIARVGRVTESGLTLSRDCPKDEAECRGRNYENAFLEEDEVLSGKYSIRVRLERLPDELGSVPATLGIRSGGSTRGFDLVFFESEQELFVEFDVAPGEDKE